MFYYQPYFHIFSIHVINKKKESFKINQSLYTTMILLEGFIGFQRVLTQGIHFLIREILFWKMCYHVKYVLLSISP